jgi:hypothetical protein
MKWIVLKKYSYYHTRLHLLYIQNYNISTFPTQIFSEHLIGLSHTTLHFYMYRSQLHLHSTAVQITASKLTLPYKKRIWDSYWPTQ